MDWVLGQVPPATIVFTFLPQECGEKKEAVHLSLAQKFHENMHETCTTNAGHAPGLNYLAQLYSPVEWRKY